MQHQWRASRLPSVYLGKPPPARQFRRDDAPKSGAPRDASPISEPRSCPTSFSRALDSLPLSLIFAADQIVTMALQVLRTPSPPSHSGSEASCSTPRGPSSRRDVAASLAHPILRHSPSIRSFTPFNNPCATSSLSRPRGPSRPYSDSSDSDDEHSRRSSALPPSSSNPLLPPLFSDHSPPSTPHPDLPIFAAFAALRKPSQAPTVETCFCGAASDDDSIYCSVACGRKDAMEALCADEIGRASCRERVS